MLRLTFLKSLKQFNFISFAIFQFFFSSTVYVRANDFGAVESRKSERGYYSIFLDKLPDAKIIKDLYPDIDDYAILTISFDWGINCRNKVVMKHFTTHYFCHASIIINHCENVNSSSICLFITNKNRGIYFSNISSGKTYNYPVKASYMAKYVYIKPEERPTIYYMVVFQSVLNNYEENVVFVNSDDDLGTNRDKQLENIKAIEFPTLKVDHDAWLADFNKLEYKYMNRRRSLDPK